MTNGELKAIAKAIRTDIVETLGITKTGHIGGSCSLADIFAFLYFEKARLEPGDVNRADRDRIILSKGHAGLIQFVSMAERGFFPKEELKTFKNLGTRLQNHPNMSKLPGIEASTGSLGQGLSIACGMAAAAKSDHQSYKVYCVMGDGEQAEGQIWEAAMAASVYKLDNLVAILDLNGYQASDSTHNCFPIGSFAEKWAAFGWDVQEMNGHDFDEIRTAFENIENDNGRPKIVIAHTVKGKGIPFAENTAAFHNGCFTGEQYSAALEAIEKGE